LSNRPFRCFSEWKLPQFQQYIDPPSSSQDPRVIVL
jgi:hypothetical protein